MTVRPPLTIAGEKTLTSLPAGIVRPAAGGIIPV